MPTARTEIDYCAGSSALATLALGLWVALLYMLVLDPAALMSPIRVAPVLVLTQLIGLSTLSSLCLAQRRARFFRTRLVIWLLPLLAAAWAGVYSLLSLISLPEGLRLDPGVNGAAWVLRNMVLIAVVSLPVSYVLALRARWVSQLAADSKAGLQALQARIRPHFLFNTLNTISSLLHDRPDQAEQATMDLSDLLRIGLQEEPTHALSDELELVRGYLRIEQLRLGERLQIDWQVADTVPTAEPIPPLLLQPLVENAVIHGIARRADGGTLQIRGERIRLGRIRFTVSNPLGDADSSPAEGNQMALDNIRQRLGLAYEERYGLKTRQADGQFIAQLTFPTTASTPTTVS